MNDQTLEELVTELKTRFLQHVSINSSGYGEAEAMAISKPGFEYPRAYLTVQPATNQKVGFDLTVVDKVLPDHTNRLDVESRTLEIIRDLVSDMVDKGMLKFDQEIEYNPTRIISEDSVEGWVTEIELPVKWASSCNKFV